MKNIFITLACCLMMSVASTSAAGIDSADAKRDSILSLITGAPSQVAGAAQQKCVNITAYGAKGDGKFDCRKAFQKALKAMPKTGEGLKVTFPAGDWFMKGPMHLVSNLTIELEKGATLRFSEDAKDYLPAVQTSWEGSWCLNISPLIYGYKLNNVAIIGEGTICGEASQSFSLWRPEQKTQQMKLRGMSHSDTPVELRNMTLVEGSKKPEAKTMLRPHLIQLYGCQEVTLQGITVNNSPFWCIHLLKCENVICRSIKFDAKLVNNDGFDPEMTRNLLIEDVDFNNGDDNVAIKAGRDNDGWHNQSNSGNEMVTPQPSENIIVRNCRFKGLHGIVIGSEMSAGVQNVWVENCVARGYTKRGFYIKTNPNRGGFVKNLYFRNNSFDEVEDLIYLTSMYAGEGADDNHFTDVCDIYVDGLKCRKATNAAIVIQGTQAKPVFNVLLKDVNVDEAKIGYATMNTLGITLQNCNLGGYVGSASSQAAAKDNLFNR